MPEDEYIWLPREDVLTFEEIARLADLMSEVGVDRLRITGGEPLMRRDVPELIRLIASRAWVRDLALTTNGVLLADAAGDLKKAGLHRLTVSLDTLRADRFHRLTRMNVFDRVIAGIDASRRAGFTGLKIDTVVTRGDNDDELVDLLEFGREHDAEVRFIEYMDVGGATKWRPEAVISRAEMLARLTDRYGAISPVGEASSAPAERFRLPDGLTFGIIASTTQPFCRTCDRARLTADGVLLLCLYAQHGTDLRRPLRAGASHETLRRVIEAVWASRADRGAEERRSVRGRAAFIPVSVLKRDAHLEMHTRGG
jgi:cyclic pyranopterin phosphate synthase